MTGLHSSKSEDETQKVFVEWSGLTDKAVEIFCRGDWFPAAGQGSWSVFLQVEMTLPKPTGISWRALGAQPCAAASWKRRPIPGSRFHPDTTADCSPLLFQEMVL